MKSTIKNLMTVHPAIIMAMAFMFDRLIDLAIAWVFSLNVLFVIGVDLTIDCLIVLGSHLVQRIKARRFCAKMAC